MLYLPYDLWLRVNKAMIAMKYFDFSKASFVSVEFYGDHEHVTTLR